MVGFYFIQRIERWSHRSSEHSIIDYPEVINKYCSGSVTFLYVSFHLLSRLIRIELNFRPPFEIASFSESLWISERRSPIKKSQEVENIFVFQITFLIASYASRMIFLLPFDATSMR